MTTPDDDLESPDGGDDLETTSTDQGDDLEIPAPGVTDPGQQDSQQGAEKAAEPDPFDDDDEDWGDPNETPEQPPAPPAPTATAPAQAGPVKNTTCLVRIRKPKTGSKARNVKRYAMKHNGVSYRFRVDFGWYEVPIDLGRKLRDVRVNNRNEDSPQVFDVQNIVKAQQIEADEQLAHKKSSEKPATDPRSATKE